MLTDMLGELGFTVTASVTQVPEALAILEKSPIDAALLDVNLGTQKIDPVADLLAARGTPFVFTTGYGNAGVPAGHWGAPFCRSRFTSTILQQPFCGVCWGRRRTEIQGRELLKAAFPAAVLQEGDPPGESPRQGYGRGGPSGIMHRVFRRRSHRRRRSLRPPRFSGFDPAFDAARQRLVSVKAR